MERELKDKVVLVTGGAEGIGYAIAEEFLQKHIKFIIIVDINETKGEDAVKTLKEKYGDKTVFIRHDVTKDRQELVKTILETYNYVDVIVNNAGVFAERSIDKTIDVNITSVIDLSYRFWDAMRKDLGGRGGTIINVASIYGFRISPYIPIYHASKFAVLSFSKSLGHPYNYNKTGVRVLAVCPGITETSMATNISTRENELTLDDFNNYLMKHEWQMPSDFARGMAEAFEKGDSGTARLIEGKKPAEEVRECYIDDPLCA